MLRERLRELTMAHIYRPEFVADPYPLYRRIRETDPVFWDARMGDGGAWMVTGYDAALTVLRDPRFSARRPQWDPERYDPPEREAVAAPLNALAHQLFVVDPPDHTRLRRQMMPAFLPRAVEALRERIETAATRLLDEVAGTGRMDAMAQYGFALPSAIVSHVLGIPPEDRDRYWRRIINWGVVVDDGPLARANPGHHLAGVGKYMDYFRDLLRRRDAHRDGLVQALADGYEQGTFQDEEELLGNLIFLLTAGQTTTAHQIGNTLTAIIGQPEVYERLAADPELAVVATPEFMRYDSSVQLTKRRVGEEIELSGHQLLPGQEVFVWIGGAHRDPARYPDPERLDLDRVVGQHLALGHGIHYCAGGQLGQLVNEIAIRLFVTRIRAPRLDPAGVERSGTPTFRGPHALPVTFV